MRGLWESVKLQIDGTKFQRLFPQVIWAPEKSTDYRMVLIRKEFTITLWNKIMLPVNSKEKSSKVTYCGRNLLKTYRWRVRLNEYYSFYWTLWILGPSGLSRRFDLNKMWFRRRGYPPMHRSFIHKVAPSILQSIIIRSESAVIISNSRFVDLDRFCQITFKLSRTDKFGITYIY